MGIDRRIDFGDCHINRNYPGSRFRRLSVNGILICLDTILCGLPICTI